MKTVLALVSFLMLFTISNFAQFDEFHPEVEWFTIKGKHVDVHFHEGSERTAQTVLKIADEVWGPITSLYDYEPDRVQYVIKDLDDYANGASYFFDNKIEIWTSALDFDLRGSHNWLRNVISHEFTHMVQIQASMKSSRSVPALYLQWLNYDDKRRPDILYEFPNVIVSYPIPTINVPAWFAEGTAQYMRRDFDYDNWDSHRDMILRSYALDDNKLTWNQMGVFGKNSLGNESVYNSGFALTLYIAQKYGEVKLKELSNALGTWNNVTMDAAVEDVLGISGEQLYDEWSQFLKTDYLKRTENVRQNLVVGEKIEDAGFGNFYPKYSDDGKYIYYISNKGTDYLSLTSLYRYNFAEKTSELVIPGVKSTFDFIPGTQTIIYSKLGDENPSGYRVHDLYSYNLNTDEEKRLTFNLRANMPSVSPDGTKITFLVQRDGTTNIATCNIDGSGFIQFTNYNDGEQVFSPTFSPSGKMIAFAYSYHHGRDIYTIDVESGKISELITGTADDRSPIFTSENDLIFSSDRTGIFNIYTINLNNGIAKQLSNVLGGAFMPSINQEGQIAYAGYTSNGYKIYIINSDSLKSVNGNVNYVRTTNPPLDARIPKGDLTNEQIHGLRNFQDKDINYIPKESYTGSFTRLSIFPFIRFDNYNTSNSFVQKLKPGLIAYTSDLLNKYSMFLGASINTRMERDLFLILEYKDRLPVLSSLGLFPELTLEAYNISRKADVDITFDELATTKTDVSYNLLEVSLAAREHILDDNSQLELKYTYSRYSATIGSFIIPIPDNPALYPSTNDTYFYGSNFGLKYEFSALYPFRDDDINPAGLEFTAQYNYEMSKFNPDGEYRVEDGILKPNYKDFNFHRIEVNSQYGHSLGKGHTLTGRMRVGSILGETVPDFFDFYLGGLIGMKSYPFYAISGNELVWMNLTYRFPLFRDIDTKFGPWYFDKVFVSVYADAGNAWSGELGDNVAKIDKYKRGVGTELRLAMNSFYLFPTAIFFNAAYGFDSYTRIANNTPVVYGKEWNFYAGVLFGFDF